MIPERMQVTIVNTLPEHIPELITMHRLIFPTLDPSEWYREAHYLNHIRLFPEGQMVALLHEDGKKRVVGSTSTFRTNFNFEHYRHTYLQAVANGWFSNHNPDGEWLYGGDLGVHPDFQRRGIGSKLYDARRQLVNRLNLRGEIAGGMLPGYERYRSEYTIEEYIQGVIEGRLVGKTLAMQVKNGFKFHGILYDHISDPRSDNCAALIVRENPLFRTKDT